MSLFLKKPRTRQPQGAVEIDRDNPLGKTITNCLPLNGVNRDIVTGNALTLFSGGSQAVDYRGRSLKGSGSAAVGSVPLNLSAYNKLTLSFWMYWDAFVNNDDFLMEHSPNTNTTDGGIVINPNDSSVAFTVYNRRINTSNGSYVKIARPSAAAWHHYAILLDRVATTASGNATRVYIDGAQIAVTYPWVAAAANSNFANSTLYLFSRNNASLFGAGKLQNLIFRGGYLMSEAEAKAEYDNPWQLFAPQARTMWLPGTVAAGGNSQSLIITLDDVTVVTSQTLQHAQNIASTLDGVSISASQTAGHAQTLTAALDSITASVSQTVGSGISQSISATLGGVTVAASQALVHVQSFTATLDGITVAASQVVGSGTYQSFAITLDDVTVAAAQTLTHDQIFEATLDSIGVEASQVVRHGQTLAWVLDDVTIAITQSVPGATYWPLPAQVLAGVQYGPTGTDYTGTAVAGSYPTAADIAAAVLAAGALTTNKFLALKD